MSHLWIPKKRRKCPHIMTCGWIGYDAPKCPICGSNTTDAAAYDPSGNWDNAVKRNFSARSKYYVVGIDLKGK